MKYKTKMFVEDRVVRRAAGAAPDAWTEVRQSLTIDEQVSDWVDRTGHTIVAASAPGFDVRWADAEMTTRSVLIAVMITYAPKEETGEQPINTGDIATDAWPERHAETRSESGE